VDDPGNGEQHEALHLRPGVLVRDGLVILVVAAAVDVVFEYARAQTALQNWICFGDSPLPQGPRACQTGFLLRWLTGRLPLYTIGVGAAGLALVAAIVASRSRGVGFDWGRLVRFVAVVVCLIALSELVACAGDATCGLSLTCT
jgi:hypothetical protein